MSDISIIREIAANLGVTPEQLNQEWDAEMKTKTVIFTATRDECDALVRALRDFASETDTVIVGLNEKKDHELIFALGKKAGFFRRLAKTVETA